MTGIICAKCDTPFVPTPGVPGCPRCDDTLPLPIPQTRETYDDSEATRLKAMINSPELENFLRAVHIEAVHQVERWGTAHDRAKRPADWFWLVGYLAGKALHAALAGNRNKALHHCISTAAALYNWHCAIKGVDVSMCPGRSDLAEMVDEQFPGEAAVEMDEATMTDEELKAITQRHVPFEPDKWVIRAMREAVAAAAGSARTQDPKYDIENGRLVNAATREPIPEDEPIFILRAKDVRSRKAIAKYIVDCANKAHRDAVQKRLTEFNKFAAEHRERMQEPDTAITSGGFHPLDSPGQASPL